MNILDKIEKYLNEAKYKCKDCGKSFDAMSIAKAKKDPNYSDADFDYCPTCQKKGAHHAYFSGPGPDDGWARKK